MEKVILYSNNCPRCNVLKAKLDDAGIQYETCNNIEIMIEKGFLSAPMLEVNGEYLKFTEAINWLNERSNK